MSRSERILGRVLRNLRNRGIPEGRVLDEEIYGELTSAQNAIISNTQPSIIIEIDLKKNQEDYFLLEKLAGNTTIEKKNIISVKVAKYKDNPNIIFDILNNIEFANSLTIFPEKGLPRIGTIINDKLRVRPIPDEASNNKILELYCYKKYSLTNIAKNNEPEVGEEYDKALELYATAQFLTGNERQQLLSEFHVELQRLMPLTHRSRGTITMQPIKGWF